MARKSKQTQKEILMQRSPLLAWVILGMLLAIAVIAFTAYQFRGIAADQACNTTNLKLKAGEKEGAAGTIYQHFVITNTGGDSCTISGYPTAFLTGADKTTLGTAAAAVSTPRPEAITLDKNESAHTILGFPQAGNFDPGICSEKSTTIRIYTPGALEPLETAASMPWCPGFSATSIKVGK